MKLPPPFWILQRQVKPEVVNDNTLRLAGPILPTCELAVQPSEQGDRFRIAIAKIDENGGSEPVTDTELVTTDADAAWQVGYELYRQHVIV